MCCGNFDDDFHFFAGLGRVEDHFVLDDAIEVGFELAAQCNDVLIGFFGDLAAVARADSGLQFLLLSASLEPRGRGIGSH